eukprot:COSAG01_NODE_2247_length_8072_cov_48.931704_3_plen_183_part_00
MRLLRHRHSLVSVHARARKHRQECVRREPGPARGPPPPHALPSRLASKPPHAPPDRQFWLYNMNLRSFGYELMVDPGHSKGQARPGGRCVGLHSRLAHADVRGHECLVDGVIGLGDLDGGAPPVRELLRTPRQQQTGAAPTHARTHAPTQGLSQGQVSSQRLSGSRLPPCPPPHRRPRPAGR